MNDRRGASELRNNFKYVYAQELRDSMRGKFHLFIFCLLFIPFFAVSKGPSPYLPLNMSAEVESQIAKLFALTPGAPLTKPYKASELISRLKIIADSYPVLHKQLSSYLQRYKQPSGLTHFSAALSAGNDANTVIPNRRGIKTDSQYELSVGGLAYISPYAYVSGGYTYAENTGTLHHNSHVGFGHEYAQVELGYREHWFSPFQDSAMLVSTQAPASPSITISNATPITDWNIRYEVFYSMLEEADGIVLGDEVFAGRPRHAGLHFSFTPLDFWTLGFNRTLQFGGGKREVSFSDVIEALFDPAGKDNVGDIDNLDPNFEFGNQQASITSQFNLNWGVPLSLYFEYAGEDTVNESNYQLGNVAKSVGLFLPVLWKDFSLRYEYSDWTNAWYTHPLYGAGYTNEGRVLGHWGGDRRVFGNDTPATTHSINLNWQISGSQLIDLTLRSLENESQIVFDYERAYELNLTYSYATSTGFWGAELYAGKDTFGENFSRLSLFYRW